MSKLLKHMSLLRDLLVLAAVESEYLDLPQYRFDGGEAKAEDVAAELRISIEEAAVRMEGPHALMRFGTKDVYGGLGSHAVRVGVGTTIQQRVGNFIQRQKKKKRKRKRKRSDNGNP